MEEDKNYKIKQDVYLALIKKSATEILDVIQSLCNSEYQYNTIRSKILRLLNDDVRSIANWIDENEQL